MSFDRKDILGSCLILRINEGYCFSVPIKTNYLEIPTFSRDSVSNRLNFDQRRKLENKRGFEKGMASIDEF